MAHGYTRGETPAYARDAALERGLDEARVHELLTLRVLAKRAGDYETADALRDELATDHCVRVWDRSREWTVSRFAVPNQAKARGEVSSHDYARLAWDATPDVDVGKVDQLLLKRLRAKMRRDFVTADAARDELRAMGVRVHDASRVWRAGVDPADSAPYADLFEEERTGVNAGADDGTRRNNANKRTNSQPWQQQQPGSSSHKSNRRFFNRPSRAYARLASEDEIDGPLDVDEVKVASLLKARHEARRTQYWAKADEILDELLVMGVDVDDAAAAWRAVRPAYVPRDDADVLALGKNESALQSIDALMRERRRAKMRRRFDEADRIREDLRANFGVGLDDADRVWFAVAANKRHKTPPRKNVDFFNVNNTPQGAARDDNSPPQDILRDEDDDDDEGEFDDGPLRDDDFHFDFDFDDDRP